MQPTRNGETISLRCPQCSARLRAPRQLLGRICPCPRCRHEIVVRVPVPSDSDVALVGDPRQPSTAGQ
jgi:hypothetical protein